MEDNNIVFFPKLKDRIISLGKKALEEKDYGKALQLCDQLKEMNEHNSQTELAAVACLLEGNKTKEAKQRCEELVFGPFESDEAIEVYISILFQLKEYEELQKSIKKLLKQKRIDENQMDKYQAMLSLSNKVAPDPDDYEIINIHNLLDQNVSLHKQLEIINELRVIDCNLVSNQIEEVLKSPEANPLIKSLILFILQEQSIDKDFEIVKMNQKMIWNSMNPSKEHELYVDSVLKRLSSVLESEDPSAFEIAKTYFQHFITIYFPLIPEPPDENVWAACFYCLIQEYFDRKINEDDLNEVFNVDFEEVQTAISLVRYYEENGYFDINGS